MNPARAMAYITRSVLDQTVFQSSRSPPTVRSSTNAAAVNPGGQEDMINDILEPCWRVLEAYDHAAEAKQAIVRDKSKFAALVMHNRNIMKATLEV